MAVNAEAISVKKQAHKNGTSAESIVANTVSNEVVFSVVGHVGSGTTEIAEILHDCLVAGGYEAHIVKARDVITAWNEENTSGFALPPGIAGAFAMQDAGDLVRETTKDNSFIARELVKQVRVTRAKLLGVEVESDKPVYPDGTKRAYILDSLRHPEEVKLLRAIYQDAFVLIGVVCDASRRKDRLIAKYDDAGSAKIEEFMKRDADDFEHPHGQKVADTFYLSDFFVDNTEPRYLNVAQGRQKSNEDWLALEELQRLIDIVTHQKLVRPTPSETAMYHAHGARMRSACLSRQVGAALIDQSGEVISTGCNEVPRAGGGVYSGQEVNDYRCAFHNGFCSSVREQNRIIDEIISQFPELQSGDKSEIVKRFRKSPIAMLLEFSRAVHAEMDALLSAARKGVSTIGSKLFVTTYPCHYCARHIIAAGVDEVQYIEPYPKSLATVLHDDAITVQVNAELPSTMSLRARINGAGEQGKVVFKPFTGVAPRLYRRSFLKERSLKDKNSGDMAIGAPVWGSAISVKQASYVDIEMKISQGDG